AKEAERLVTARLKDAELVLRTENPTARLCGDEATHDRLVEAEKRRLEVIAELKRNPAKKDQRLLFEVLRESDPSPSVRALAGAR
ncbi:MAG: HEAT repeat domain-containing protein, partial [Archangium sp.]|nr:HEAT repeat domain-containing protein [Archangium sp.]